MNFIKKNNQTTLIHFGFIDFYTGDYNRLYQRLRLLIKDKHRQCKLIGYINPHVYNKAQEFIPVKKFISDCDFVCIDGVGITLSARFLSGLSLSRVVATHLFDAILDCDDINACAILIGTTKSEVKKARSIINNRSRGLHIIADYHGFHDNIIYNQIFIKHKNVDAVLVGMGTPKSEQILLQAKLICKKAICWHIGAGTIKIYAGTKRRSPTVVSKIGLEWVHRIIFEPEIRDRYFSGGIIFIRNLLGLTVKPSKKV
jgi:exopolysaccharide biosynthesis WecB/TagA/CpsF family protein